MAPIKPALYSGWRTKTREWLPTKELASSAEIMSFLMVADCGAHAIARGQPKLPLQATNNNRLVASRLHLAWHTHDTSGAEAKEFKSN